MLFSEYINIFKTYYFTRKNRKQLGSYSFHVDFIDILITT